jgi:hypothetical protein
MGAPVFNGKEITVNVAKQDTLIVDLEISVSTRTHCCPSLTGYASSLFR